MRDYGITLTREEETKLDRMVASIRERIAKEKMTPRERIDAVLKGKPVDRLPIWVNGVGMHAPKAYGITPAELCSDPKLALFSYMHYVDRFKSDTFPNFRFSLGDEEFGAETMVTDFGVPFTIEGYIRDYADIEKIKFPDIYKDGSLPWMLWLIHVMKEKLGDVMPVWGFVTTPGLTATCPGARDYGQASIDIIQNPNLTLALTAFATKFTIDFGRAQLEAGADAVSLVDATADASPKQFHEFMYPYLCGVYHALGGKVIWSAADDVSHVIEDYAQLGIDHFYLGSGMPLERAKEVCAQYGVTLRYSLSSELMTHGDRESIRREVKRLIDVGNAGGHFILATAALDADTPEENIDTFVEAAMEYGKS